MFCVRSPLAWGHVWSALRIENKKQKKKSKEKCFVCDRRWRGGTCGARCALKIKNRKRNQKKNVVCAIAVGVGARVERVARRKENNKQTKKRRKRKEEKEKKKTEKEKKRKEKQKKKKKKKKKRKERKRKNPKPKGGVLLSQKERPSSRIGEEKWTAVERGFFSCSSLRPHWFVITQFTMKLLFN